MRNESINSSSRVLSTLEEDACSAVQGMLALHINYVRKSFNPHISGVICPAKGRCKPGNVDITCGNARLKRSVDAQNAVLSVKFNNENVS
ncbi:hypothetical protein CEXT_311701 [Caerostris extrusa]|uniref:Uncharacterized protein n=1 Tax=Caerostris extrusa TaxID=172846 RepID=A0AAV4NX97_CAEEX|nr:hypothetical protein CEXT_311701 [Caerostris extrusa]